MRGRVSRFLTAPGAPESIAVLVVVAVAVAAALVRYPAALSELGDLAERNAAQSYSDREIAGGNAVLPDQRLVYEARARIGEDERYAVAVGEPLESWPPLYEHALVYARYFLAPRTADPDAAWLLCLNCDSRGGQVVWQDEEEGVSLVKRG